MPALPNVPNVVKVQFRWSDNSDTGVYSNMFFQYSGPAPTSSAALAMATSAYAAMAAHASQWGADTFLTGCKLTDLSSDTSGEGDYTASTVGTRSGESFPGGVAVCVNYAIGRRYRGGRPRNYFPWFTEADLGNRQAWAGASVTGNNTAMAAFFTAMTAITSGSTSITSHVNVSYYQGFTVEGGTGGKRAKNVSTPRTTPVVDQILSFSTLARPASQRKRNI